MRRRGAKQLSGKARYPVSRLREWSQTHASDEPLFVASRALLLSVNSPRTLDCQRPSAGSERSRLGGRTATCSTRAPISSRRLGANSASVLGLGILGVPPAVERDDTPSRTAQRSLGRQAVASMSTPASTRAPPSTRRSEASHPRRLCRSPRPARKQSPRSPTRLLRDNCGARWRLRLDGREIAFRRLRRR